MAKFEVAFEIKGVGEVSLPVTLLDDAIVLVEGVEQKLFRFTIQNVLDRDLVFNLIAVTGGVAVSKVAVSVAATLAVAIGATETVEVTIAPTEALHEGDDVTVMITGTEVVV